MRNRQGNCTHFTHAITLPILNAISTPKWHENACDFTIITYHHSSYSYSLCKLKRVQLQKGCNYGNESPLVYRDKCTVINIVCDYAGCLQF